MPKPRNLEESLDQLVAVNLSLEPTSRERQTLLDYVKFLLRELPSESNDVELFSIEQVRSAVKGFEPHTVQEHEEKIRILAYLEGVEDHINRDQASQTR